MRLIPRCVVLWLCCWACSSAWAEPQPETCTPPVVFPAVPGYIPIYADREAGGAFSQVDPQAYRQMQQTMAGFWQGQHTFLKMTDRVARDGRANEVHCALVWLHSWAAGGHMLQPPQGSLPEQYQSRYEMKWALQGIATAYVLTLKGRASLQERAQIEPWLQAAGQQVAAFNIERPGVGKLNNHYYWGGAAVMAVAVAVGDRRLRDLAKTTYRAGIDAITDAGTLPRENLRRQQALHYHLFALTPLVMMAELSRMAGEDWYQYRPERLQLLQSRVLQALAAPDRGAETWGETQDSQLLKPCSDDWGWTYFTERPEAFAWRPAVGQCSSRLLGGDLALLKARGLFAQRFPWIPARHD